jgi:hypothetical protein
MRLQGNAKPVAVIIPRRAFEERLGTTAALSGRAMNAARRLTEIVAGFLSMLPSRIDAVGGIAAPGSPSTRWTLLPLRSRSGATSPPPFRPQRRPFSAQGDHRGPALRSRSKA